MNASFPDEKDLRAAKILIVDDENTGLRCLELALRKSDFLNYLGLTDSTLARESFLKFKPDLVLLDLNMPNLDGFGVLAQIRAEESAGDFVPVMILTGDSTSEARSRAMAAGASDFLDKPVDYSVLLLRIKNALRTRFLFRQNQELRARLESLTGNVEANA